MKPQWHRRTRLIQTQNKEPLAPCLLCLNLIEHEQTVFRRKDYVSRRQMLYAEASKMCRRSRDDHSCAAEVTITPSTSPRYFAYASKDFANASKIFRRRVQRFHRRRCNAADLTV